MSNNFLLSVKTWNSKTKNYETTAHPIAINGVVKYGGLKILLRGDSIGLIKDEKKAVLTRFSPVIQEDRRGETRRFQVGKNILNESKVCDFSNMDRLSSIKIFLSDPTEGKPEFLKIETMTIVNERTRL